MIWKLLILTICVSAVLLQAQALELGEHNYDHHQHDHAEYEFHYAVNDHHTGDIKSQKEVRHGDKVEGTYELIDSDGHHRVVHYKADDHNGFEAIVHREPTNIKIPVPEQHHKILGAKILTHGPLVHYSHP